jgi:hypothetical protein
VWSLTVKAHENTPVSGGSLNFTTAANASDTFWKGVELWNANIPSVVSQNVFAVMNIDDEGNFTAFIHGPDVPAEKITAMFTDLLSNLKSIGIDPKFNVTQYPDYFTEYSNIRDIWAEQIGNAEVGGRLLPRSLIENNNSALITVMQKLVNGGIGFKGFCLNITGKADEGQNAVLPAWRETVLHVELTQ